MLLVRVHPQLQRLDLSLFLSHFCKHSILRDSDACRQLFARHALFLELCSRYTLGTGPLCSHGLGTHMRRGRPLCFLRELAAQNALALARRRLENTHLGPQRRRHLL